MNLDTVLFYVFALMTLAGAVQTIVHRSAVHCAIWLIVSLLGTAGLYLLQQAEFLFAVQIILYIGGIMVLFLFVIMLVNLDQQAHERQFKHQWWLGLTAVLLTGGEILFFIWRGAGALPPAAVPRVESIGNTERIGDLLFSEYLLPFELVSLLLLVAIVGSVMMAKKRLA